MVLYSVHIFNFLIFWNRPWKIFKDSIRNIFISNFLHNLEFFVLKILTKYSEEKSVLKKQNWILQAEWRIYNNIIKNKDNGNTQIYVMKLLNKLSKGWVERLILLHVVLYGYQCLVDLLIWFSLILVCLFNWITRIILIKYIVYIWYTTNIMLIFFK